MGTTWRDLPSDFDAWSAVYRRFNPRSKKDVLNKIFAMLTQIVYL
jgi:transposase